MNFAHGKIPLGDKSPQKRIHNAPAEETSKHHAKFAWPPVSNVAAVMKPTRETD